MKIRTLVGALVALALIVGFSYVSHHNATLLTEPVQLAPNRTVPLFVAVLGIFLLGFLPPVVALVVHTVREQLASRRRRREEREARSRQGSLRRALDFHADGQWGRALEEYERVLDERPEEFVALVHYGEALRRAGRAAEAIEVHRRASVLYPQSVMVLEQLADDYDAAGEPDVGREVRDRILRDFESVSLSVLRRRRNAALGARDWRQAAELQDRIQALLTANGETALLDREQSVQLGLAYQRGVEAIESDRPTDARRAFESLIQREPGFIPARIMLGEAELEAGREAAALEAWRGGFQETGSPVFLQRIEDYFIDQGEPVRAIESLRELIASSENDLLPRFYLGRLYYRLEMHEEALKVLEGLEDRIRTSPTYHLVLGRIHERRGEMGRAVQHYRASVQNAGLLEAEYVCRICRSKYADWRDHCEVCRSWNSVELDFEEEKIAAEALGVREAPVWGVGEEEGEA